jgi:hypothetical protein
VDSGRPFVKVGVLVGGENAVRAAHSLSAEAVIDQVVVIGPAKSDNFKVVKDASGLDVLIGSGPEAPGQARHHGRPLVWDGDGPADGVVVWGASIPGLAAAMGARHRKPSIVAAAHPQAPTGSEGSVRFPRPVGATQVSAVALPGTVVSVGKSYNEYGACVVESKRRQVTVVDIASFLAGIALAAGIAAYEAGPTAVWDRSLPYLEMAHSMGLVMAEAPA